MGNQAFELLCNTSFFENRPIMHDDSRLISPGDIFVLHSNNRNYLKNVLNAKPSFVLFWKDSIDIIKDANIRICNTEEDLKYIKNDHIGGILMHEDDSFASLLNKFYSGIDIKSIAVTGTNGKTSVVSFVRQILSKHNIFCTSIELGNVVIDNDIEMKIKHSLTTPSIYDMHKILYVSQNKYNAKAIAFEASSHGIEQGRIKGIKIETAAFTNFSQDHLDYHKTMESYFNAKKKLFESYLHTEGTAILNYDIKEFTSLEKICKERGIKILTYGKTGGNVHLLRTEKTSNGQRITYNINNKEYTFNAPFFGSFQAVNLACSIAICITETEGKILENIDKIISTIKSPKGRMQPVYRKNGNISNVYIDYGHTPDAIETVLCEINEYKPKRLISVIGCGGDRDATKRQLIGDIASNLSDVVFVTDDNPRTEDPSKIREEIISGASLKNKDKIINISNGRAEAIQTAIRSMEEEDILVIFGKGSEDYQIINTTKIPFKDYDIAANELS